MLLDITRRDKIRSDGPHAYNVSNPNIWLLPMFTYLLIDFQLV